MERLRRLTTSQRAHVASALRTEIKRAVDWRDIAASKSRSLPEPFAAHKRADVKRHNSNLVALRATLAVVIASGRKR